jgi:hypothetical protein
VGADRPDPGYSPCGTASMIVSRGRGLRRCRSYSLPALGTAPGADLPQKGPLSRSGCVGQRRIALQLRGESEAVPLRGQAGDPGLRDPPESAQPEIELLRGNRGFRRPLVPRGSGKLSTDGRHRDQSDHVLSTLHGSDRVARNTCPACPDLRLCPSGGHAVMDLRYCAILWVPKTRSRC